MTVYVDEPRPCRFRKWRESAHMTADTEDELHRFAQRIGLKRAWFQPAKRQGFSPAHYDLFGMMIEAALLNGATQTTAREMLRRARELAAAMEQRP